jgi:hypothetical protein
MALHFRGGSLVDPDSPAASDRIFQIIAGFWTARTVYVAARLGLADLVAGGPRTTNELAEATGTHAPSLYRVLRALAGEGFFVEDNRGRFGLTALGEPLRSNVPGSLRSAAISQLGEDHYEPWGDLLHSVTTGETAFDHRFGMPVFDYYSAHPEAARVFNESMTGLTRTVEAAVVQAYDFSPYKRIVDVGGGHGGFLAAILAANPDAGGILADMPEVAEGARQRFEADGLRGRCDAIGGDFFEAVPGGGDLYTLKWIVHDWDDGRSTTLLRNVRKAMARGAKVLLVESVLPGRNEPSIGKYLDLNMMVMTGGRERTEDEFRRLLAGAGFRLARVVPTASMVSVVEAFSDGD